VEGLDVWTIITTILRKLFYIFIFSFSVKKGPTVQRKENIYKKSVSYKKRPFKNVRPYRPKGPKVFYLVTGEGGAA